MVRLKIDIKEFVSIPGVQVIIMFHRIDKYTALVVGLLSRFPSYIEGGLNISKYFLNNEKSYKQKECVKFLGGENQTRYRTLYVFLLNQNF